MANTKSALIDLAATGDEWRAIDSEEADIDQMKASLVERQADLDSRKWEVARKLWTSHKKDGVYQKIIAQRTGHGRGNVSNWIVVWENRAEFQERQLSFTEALQEVKTGIVGSRARSQARTKRTTQSYLKNASTDEKAKIAAELLEDDDVQEELGKSPERGGKVAAALIENGNVAKAVQKVLDNRRQPDEVAGALGMTPSELKAKTKELQERRHQRYKVKHGADAKPPSAAESIRQQKEAGKGPKLSPEQENQEDLETALHMIAEDVITVKEARDKGARVELADKDVIDELAEAVKYLQTMLKGIA